MTASSHFYQISDLVSLFILFDSFLSCSSGKNVQILKVEITQSKKNSIKSESHGFKILIQ